MPLTTQRTVTLHLPHDGDLADTVHTANAATNLFLQVGCAQHTWDKKHLQREGYYIARANWPNLQSNLVQGARDMAAEALKQCKCESLPAKKQNSAIRFNQRTFKAYLESGQLSLATIGGRHRYPIKIPKHFEYAMRCNVAGIRVANEVGGHRVELIVDLDDPPPANLDQSGVVLGVDRGITNIVVSSDGDFFDSKQLRRVRGRTRHLRRGLQAKGTRSAKRHLKRLSGRERRFQADVNHCIAKGLATKEVDAIALEDLHIATDKKLGRRFNRKLGGWAYHHLETVLAYKLEAAGKGLLFVDPAYTSKNCSRCGARGTRKASSFSCKCGYSLNADLNAARNIAQRGKALLGRHSVKGPIVAGNELRQPSHGNPGYKPPTSMGGT